MNNNPIIKPECVPNPFKYFCMSIGYVPTSYKDSLDYMEQILWLIKFLENKVIPAVDNNALAVTELQQFYIELQSYVNNYFNNLDVQEEINNKLDQMAEDGTLEEIIGNYLSGQCLFVFPGKWGTDLSSGNSNLIIVDGKTILFDTNSGSVYDYLKSMLFENNVSHIDYVVITHYDSDHRGNLVSLINDGYIDENSKYIHTYCPVSIYGQAVVNVYNQIEDLCQSIGIESIIPNENEIINVSDNFSMRFGNVDLTYILNNYSSPNQASMVIETKHNNSYSLIMGDAVKEAQKYLYDSNFIQNQIDLYVIPHHAIEHECYLPFYELINPKIAVAQSQMSGFNLGIFSYNQDSAILYEKGCANYYSFNNTYNIKFLEQYGNLECIQGIPTPHSGYSHNSQYIYCDSVNYNESIQNGTEQYPYKDIIQALGIVPDFNNKEIIIKLKPGTYGTTYTGVTSPNNNIANILNRKNYIVISGTSKDNTILNYGMNITNCNNVRIENLTIKKRNNGNCLNITYSNVMVRDCIFLGEDGDTLSDYGIYAYGHSNVDTINCSYQYLESAYSLVALSKIKSTNDTFNNLNYICKHENGVTVDIGHINDNTDLTTIAHLDNYSATRYIFANPLKYRYTLNSAIMTGDVNLPFSLNNIYKYMVINYICRLNGSNAGIGKHMIPFENVSSYLLTATNCRDNGDIMTYNMLLNISTNKIVINKNKTIQETSAGVITSYTPDDASDDSYGIKITSIDFI